MIPSLLPLVLFIALLPLMSATTMPPRRHHHHHHASGLKSMHFSLYQHETINKTGYIIVNGVAGPSVSQTTTPFGTLFAFQDPLRATANGSSEALGVAEGASITSGLDGLSSISIATISLDVEGHKGSISIIGNTHNIKPSDHPVVGGTGDFLFAQGYVTSSPVDLKGITVVYKIDFHIYWPPFAAMAAMA